MRLISTQTQWKKQVTLIDKKIITLWHFGAGVIILLVYGFAVKPPSTVISVPVI